MNAVHAALLIFKRVSATKYLPKDYTKRVDVGRLFQFKVFIKSLIPTTLRIKITNGTHDAVLVRRGQTHFFSRPETRDFWDSLVNQDITRVLESIERMSMSPSLFKSIRYDNELL